MRYLILAAALLAPTAALAALPTPPKPPAKPVPTLQAPKPDPLVRSCAEAATRAFRRTILLHADVIADEAQIAALKAQVAKLRGAHHGLTTPPPVVHSSGAQSARPPHGGSP